MYLKLAKGWGGGVGSRAPEKGLLSSSLHGQLGRVIKKVYARGWRLGQVTEQNKHDGGKMSRRRIKIEPAVFLMETVEDGAISPCRERPRWLLRACVRIYVLQ